MTEAIENKTIDGGGGDDNEPNPSLVIGDGCEIGLIRRPLGGYLIRLCYVVLKNRHFIE
jgi:hypothetical protein